MSSKLSMYLVETQPVAASDETVRPNRRRYLVIAESAAQAGDRVAFRDDHPFEQVEEVGRLGEYEPGMEGHALVMSWSRGVIVLTEEVSS